MQLINIDYVHNIDTIKRFLSILTLLMLIEPAKLVELLTLDVPGWVPLGTRAALSCRWQLGPADVLYSVKWYKDGKEFFRHVPRDAEPHRRFPLPGVDVEDSDSSGANLVLSPATMESGGRYRCEVSGERPLFPTVSQHADMNIVALPEHGPAISGFRSKYRPRDRVRANCSSGHSRPAAQLSWYINGEPMPVDEYTTSYRSEHELIVTSLTLDFEVTEAHFRKNVLKVKCLATIIPVYWKSIEEAAVLEKTTDHREIELQIQNPKSKILERSQANFANTNIFNFRTFQLFGIFTLKYFIRFLC